MKGRGKGKGPEINEDSLVDVLRDEQMICRMDDVLVVDCRGFQDPEEVLERDSTLYPSEAILNILFPYLPPVLVVDPQRRAP